MLHCTKHEERLIKSGKSNGVVMRYDPSSGCPHEPGGTITFIGTKKDTNGRPEPFAEGIVVSVRPGTVRAMADDSDLVKADGFGTGHSWKSHLRVKYRGIRDSARVYHIKFRVKDVKK